MSGKENKKKAYLRSVERIEKTLDAIRQPSEYGAGFFRAQSRDDGGAVKSPLERMGYVGPEDNGKGD